MSNPISPRQAGCSTSHRVSSLWVQQLSSQVSRLEKGGHYVELICKVFATKLFSSSSNHSQTGSKKCCRQEKGSDHKCFYCFYIFSKTWCVFNIYYFFSFLWISFFPTNFVSKFLVKLQTLHWVVNLELSFILWIEKMLQIIVFFKRKSLMGWQQNTFFATNIRQYLNTLKFNHFWQVTKKAQGTRSF